MSSHNQSKLLFIQLSMSERFQFIFMLMLIERQKVSFLWLHNWNEVAAFSMLMKPVVYYTNVVAFTDFEGLRNA